MYSAREKNRYIHDAVELLLVMLMDPSFNQKTFFPKPTDIEGFGSGGHGIHPLAHNGDQRMPNPEEGFENWYRSAVRDTKPIPEDWLPGLEYDDDDCVAGYEPMNSPGIIRMHMTTMSHCFGELVKYVIGRGFRLDFKTLRSLAEIRVRKSFFHEYFHHYADIQRILTNLPPYDRMREEPLAVAWSRVKLETFLKKDLKVSSPDPMYSAFLRAAYNYQQLGYKDWVNFFRIDGNWMPILTELTDFCNAVWNYTLPPASARLVSNGVRFNNTVLSAMNWTYKDSNGVRLVMDLL